jgi:hypothetical protein
MDKRLLLAFALTAVLATACKKSADLSAAPPRHDIAAADASAEAPASTAKRTANPAAKPDASKPLPVTAPDLAYAFDYSVEAPSKNIPSLVRQHEAECSMAGATVCQVVGASTRSIGNDDVSGRLEIRAAPDWIAKFRDRIADDVKAIGGKIHSAETGTEDLSRSLVDTQADIRAKIELRDRLEGLLRNHKGKLEDLVSLEQQVAGVQGQIDAAQSELAVMKTRVQTEKLVIEYTSLAALAPDSAFRPVSQAAHGFLRNTMGGVAVILTVVSILLPFGLVGGLGWMVVRRRRPPVLKQPD